jgi:hypothetical protein
MKNIFVLSVLFIACWFLSIEGAEVGTYQMYFNGDRAYLVNTTCGLVYKEGEWTFDGGETFHEGFAIRKFLVKSGNSSLPIELGEEICPYSK